MLFDLVKYGTQQSFDNSLGINTNSEKFGDGTVAKKKFLPTDVLYTSYTILTATLFAKGVKNNTLPKGYYIIKQYYKSHGMYAPDNTTNRGMEDIYIYYDNPVRDPSNSAVYIDGHTSQQCKVKIILYTNATLVEDDTLDNIKAAPNYIGIEYRENLTTNCICYFDNANLPIVSCKWTLPVLNSSTICKKGGLYAHPTLYNTYLIIKEGTKLSDIEGSDSAQYCVIFSADYYELDMLKNKDAIWFPKSWRNKFTNGNDIIVDEADIMYYYTEGSNSVIHGGSSFIGYITNSDITYVEGIGYIDNSKGTFFGGIVSISNFNGTIQGHCFINHNYGYGNMLSGIFSEHAYALPADNNYMENTTLFFGGKVVLPIRDTLTIYPIPQ